MQLNKIKVGIVGGTGYTGVELLRLLATHPGTEIACITSRGEAGQRVSDMFPSLRGYIDLPFIFRQRLFPSGEILLQLLHRSCTHEAVGNFNAHLSAYPQFDWEAFAQKFVTGLNVRRSACVKRAVPSSSRSAKLFRTLQKAASSGFLFLRDGNA